MNESKTKWLMSLVVIALMFTVVGTTSAQGKIAVTLRAGRDDITVGDVIPLTLYVTHPAGWRVVVPALEKQWGEFEVRGQAIPSITANGDGTETTTQTIEVVRMRPGEVQTPAWTVAVADDQGNLQNIEVAPVSLTVQSVLVAGDSQLRDLKPQAQLVTSRRTIAPIIAVAVLTLIVGGVSVIRQRRNRPVVDKRTPRQRALDTLKALEAQNPQRPEGLKAACVEIAICLREYIAATTTISARDMTTNELARQLKISSIPAEWSAHAVDVLRICDSVKFAGDVLVLTTIHGLTDMTEMLVKQYPPAQQAAPKARHSESEEAA